MGQREFRQDQVGDADAVVAVDDVAGGEVLEVGLEGCASGGAFHGGVEVGDARHDVAVFIKFDVDVSGREVESGLHVGAEGHGELGAGDLIDLDLAGHGLVGFPVEVVDVDAGDGEAHILLHFFVDGEFGRAVLVGEVGEFDFTDVEFVDLGFCQGVLAAFGGLFNRAVEGDIGDGEGGLGGDVFAAGGPVDAGELEGAKGHVFDDRCFSLHFDVTAQAFVAGLEVDDVDIFAFLHLDLHVGGDVIEVDGHAVVGEEAEAEALGVDVAGGAEGFADGGVEALESSGAGADLEGGGVEVEVGEAEVVDEAGLHRDVLFGGGVVVVEVGDGGAGHGEGADVEGFYAASVFSKAFGFAFVGGEEVGGAVDLDARSVEGTEGCRARRAGEVDIGEVEVGQGDGREVDLAGFLVKGEVGDGTAFELFHFEAEAGHVDFDGVALEIGEAEFDGASGDAGDVEAGGFEVADGGVDAARDVSNETLDLGSADAEALEGVVGEFELLEFDVVDGAFLEGEAHLAGHIDR